MPVLLATYKNKSAGFVLREKKKQITIGRDPGNDMPLPMTRVSRVHATLTCKNHEWFIRDLGSSNGTKVNNVKIRGTMAIKPGDMLRLGNVRLQLVDSEKIPTGVKRLKDRRDYTERIRFTCKYCSQPLKAMARDAGRRVQCHHCSQIVHVPGHAIGKTKKQQRPESPELIGLATDENPNDQSMMIMTDDMKAAAKEKVTLEDVHDELAELAPQTIEEHKPAARDQAQAMRQLRKAELKKELFRDDRNPLEKIWSRVLINFVLQYSKLKDPTFPVHRWHVAVLTLTLTAFITMRMLVGGGGLASVEAAPSQFAVTCSGCGHESHMTLDRFEQLSFFMMHPDSFTQKYPGQPNPQPSVCTDCGKTHTAMRLTVDPDNGQRRVMAMAQIEESLQLAKAK